jgi:hypothetical protein
MAAPFQPESVIVTIMASPGDARAARVLAATLRQRGYSRVHLVIFDGAYYTATIRAPRSRDRGGQHAAYDLARRLSITAPEVRTEVKLFLGEAELA